MPDMPDQPAAPEPLLVDDDLVLHGLDDATVDDGVVAFEAIWQHERVGRVELLHGDAGDAELIWLFVPQYRAVGEFDGLVKYGRLLRPGQDAGQAVFEEKRREDAIRDEDWRVTRWTWPDLEPFEGVARRIERSFRR